MSFFFGNKKNHKNREINPDEILMDSSNLCQYDRDQFEGRLEKPISTTTLYAIGFIFTVVIIVFAVWSGDMQIVHGGDYRDKSENNMLRPVPIFSGRGVIYDRNGVELAWNVPGPGEINKRKYATTTGLSHIIGYVSYPSKDSNGFYYQDDFVGISGAEKYFDGILKGTLGSRLVEVDAKGNIISENIVDEPIQGGNVTLSIDSRVQSALYWNIKDIAERVGFSGGAGIIMDVRTGELIALTSYPEFNSQIMSDKDNVPEVKRELNDSRLLFLDRALHGLYTPGSIVKPYIALGVLNEGVIDPSTVIITNGSISIPNPYDSTKATIFRDWKNLGPLDLRHAIAMSSDVYFYTVGGGYKDQKGLGINNIDKYLKMFGFGSTTMSGQPSFLIDKAGTIPTPEWKKATFNEDWYLGDTYHTAIGQYGFQVTPIQIARAVSTIATEGTMVAPTIIKGDSVKVESTISIPRKYFDIIHEGMRLGTQVGTSVALNVPYVTIAAKSGTAELGVTKDRVNSWITGFWPYENPKYTFVVMLEKGSVHNLIGAVAAMRQQLDWMEANTPEYFK